jgi:hypothetical protein
MDTRLIGRSTQAAGRCRWLDVRFINTASNRRGQHAAPLLLEGYALAQDLLLPACTREIGRYMP